MQAMLAHAPNTPTPLTGAPIRSVGHVELSKEANSLFVPALP